MTTSMFLTPDELHDLTGLVNPAAQERLLRSWGISVFRNRANRVMLSREALTRWQLGERISTKSEPKLRLLHAKT